MNEHDRLVDRAAREARAVLFVGGLDSGKSSMARATAAYALTLGRSVAYLDADVSQKTVGPPGTVGLKHIREPDDLTHDRMAQADAIGFVGSTSPQDHLLPLVGRSRASASGRTTRGRSSSSSTPVGRSPDPRPAREVLQGGHARARSVVALQRGEELEPIVGVVERFFGVEVVRLGIHPAVVPTTVDERMAQREESMRRYFTQPLQRFRVRPTVFMPSLPPLFDLSQLDRLLVGLSDGEGGFTGVGYLEPVSGNGGLRLISPVAEAPKALRLGSVRLEESFRAKRIDLRNLFGTE